MEISIELLQDIARRSIYYRELDRLHAQKELLQDLDMEKSQKYRDVIQSIDIAQGIVNAMRVIYVSDYIDVSEYGANAFNWPLNKQTADFFALSALVEGKFCQAGLEVLGINASTAYMYDE